MIKDDQPLPRSKWPIAKVEQLIRGKDGHIRGAKLRSTTKTGKKGSIHRPLAKIIPFEIAEDRQSSPELPTAPVVTVPSPNEICEKVVHNRGRTSTRKAAIEGQNLRRLKERFL